MREERGAAEMSKKPDKPKLYCIELTEKQVRIVNMALEQYFRVRMNQWWDLADSLAAHGVDFSPENPNHDRIFNTFLNTRDAVREVFACAGRILWPNLELKQSEEQCIGEDIWQVLRHELWKNSKDRNKKNWTVDAQEPLKLSKEPLPTVTIKES